MSLRKKVSLKLTFFCLLFAPLQKIIKFAEPKLKKLIRKIIINP